VSGASSNLLTAIVGATRRIVELREAAMPARVLEAAVARPPRGVAFEAALDRTSTMHVIAECKRRSPARGILRDAYDPAAHALAYARAGAAAISVLTEPCFFDGALEHLTAVRDTVDIPVLRKDFVVTEYQVIEAAAYGADAVLLIVAALDAVELRQLLGQATRLGLAALVEVHDEDELRLARETGARIIGVNCRDLRTLVVDLAVHDKLAALLPDGTTAVAESGIRTPADLRRLHASGYAACLVGERLIAQPDPGRALTELVGEWSPA
jgi:indole-3-glycerol phosphate synthase